MKPAHLALIRAERRLVERLEQLEARLDGGDPEAWREYAGMATALAAIAPQLTPEATGGLLTTRELAERLHVHPKTILRRRKRGELQPAAVLGHRGRAALRWAAR